MNLELGLAQQKLVHRVGKHLKRGFSVVEASIAAVLLGVVTVGIVTAMRDSSIRTSNAVQRQMALTIAKGQVQRIRAAGPLAYQTNIDTFTVNSIGVRDGSGRFKVNVLRGINCIGGVQTGDHRSSVVSGVCGDTIVPVISYRVAVQYPERKAGAASAMTMAQGVNLNMTFDVNALSSGGPCAYPQVWSGSSCGCPAGQTYNNAYNTCDCPAGQTWTGSSCANTTCQSSQYQIRSDCAGSQTGSSTWRKDPNIATCVYGGWYEVTRSCSCPAGQTWNGTACVSSCPSGQTWNGTACVSSCSAGQTWNGTACVSSCPSGQTWNGTACVSSCSSGQTWNGTACVCSQPTTVDSTATCSTNYSGSNTYRKTINSSTCVYGAYALYSSSCVCSAPAQNTRIDPCPANYTGAGINMAQDSTSCGVYGAWTERSRSCTCSAAAYTTSTGPCASGYSGTINYRADSTSCGVYGAPYQTSNTCTANVCVPTKSQTGTGGYDSTSAGGDMNWSPQGSERCTNHITWVDSTNSCTGAVTRSSTTGPQSCVPKFTMGWEEYVSTDNSVYPGIVTRRPISKIVDVYSMGDVTINLGQDIARYVQPVALDSAGNRRDGQPAECSLVESTSNPAISYVDTSRAGKPNIKTIQPGQDGSLAANQDQNGFSLWSNAPGTANLTVGCSGLPSTTSGNLVLTTVCQAHDEHTPGTSTRLPLAQIDQYTICQLGQVTNTLVNHCTGTSTNSVESTEYANCSSSVYSGAGPITYAERDSVIYQDTYTTGSGAGWVTENMTITYFYSDMYDNGVRVLSSYFGQEKMAIATPQDGSWSTRDSIYTIRPDINGTGSTTICSHVRASCPNLAYGAESGCQGINTTCQINFAGYTRGY